MPRAPGFLEYIVGRRMDHPTLSSVATLKRIRLSLPSQVVYDLAQVAEEGMVHPQLLGQGRFAKVYAAQQSIAGQPSRFVAIKVLHDHADYNAERLFSQEVALNREFAAGPTQGVSPILDVIPLGPLVLCGCGMLYHPTCPKGCGAQLQRANLKSRPFPSLRCSSSKCDYELSAEFVHQKGSELYSHRAKPCCKEGDPHADHGTIINFVLREAMVMESLEMSLADFSAYKEDRDGAAGRDIDLLGRIQHFFGLSSTRSRLRQLDRKVELLRKVQLMVQIGETVAWLHGKQVVHKDLAPDNIMIRHAPCGAVSLAFNGDPLTARLDQAANACAQICVIDFGLSDKEKLTRSWYENAETSMATTKLPYLSPEARYQRQPIGATLELDAAQRRFRVPASLEQSPASIRPNDIIVNSYDQAHEQDLTVLRIENDGGQRFAFFEGVPPRASSRSLDIVRPLGEAHDVYALGAVLYYILTGRHDQVEQLSNLAGSIQDQPCALDRRSLSRRDNYQNRRNSIREPFWRDALMVVILRAMVRGRPESFVSDRTVRGPDPAQRFLADLKRIQQGLISEVFAERDHTRAIWTRRAAAILLGALLTSLCMRACEPPSAAARGSTATAVPESEPGSSTTSGAS